MKAIRIALVLAAAAAPAAAQDKLKFEPKFTANVPFYQEVSTEVRQQITVQGASEIKLTHSQTFQFKWLPTKQDGDKWTVELYIEGLKLNIDIATNVVKYDSAVADGDPGQNPVLAEFFRKLKATKFTFTIGKGGVVTPVDGRDEFLKNLGGANPQMETVLKKILADESLKEMGDPMGGLTSPGEMTVGQDWPKKSTIPLGPVGSYERNLKFIYKGKDTTPGADNLYKVDVIADMAYKPPAPAETGDGLLFRIKGGSLKPYDQKDKNGTFTFNAAKGYVAEADLTLKLTGKLTVALGTSTETEVDVTLTQTTKLKTQDSSFNVVSGPKAGPGVPVIPPPIAPPPMPPLPPKK